MTMSDVRKGWMLREQWDALVRGEGCPACAEVRSGTTDEGYSDRRNGDDCHAGSAGVVVNAALSHRAHRTPVLMTALCAPTEAVRAAPPRWAYRLGG
jgi:hypothetical protein